MKKGFIIHDIALEKLIDKLINDNGNTELLYDNCLKYHICPNCGSNGMVTNRIAEQELYGGVVVKYMCGKCNFNDESYF